MNTRVTLLTQKHSGVSVQCSLARDKFDKISALNISVSGFSPDLCLRSLWVWQSPALIWVAASSVARAQPPVSRCEAESGLQSLIKRWRRGRGLKVKQWALFNCSDSFLQGYDGNPSNFGLCSAFNCNYLYTLFNLIDESPIFGSNRSSRSANLCPISPPSSQTFTISLPSDGTSFFQSHIHLWVI